MKKRITKIVSASSGLALASVLAVAPSAAFAGGNKTVETKTVSYEKTTWTVTYTKVSENNGRNHEHHNNGHHGEGNHGNGNGNGGCSASTSDCGHHPHGHHGNGHGDHDGDNQGKDGKWDRDRKQVEQANYNNHNCYHGEKDKAPAVAKSNGKNKQWS